MASLLYTKVGIQKHLCRHKTTWLLYFTQRLVFKNIFAGTRQHGFSTLDKGWCSKTSLQAQDNMASLLYTKVGVQKHLCGHKTTWLLYFRQRLVFKNIFAGTRQHGFSTLHKGWCSKTSLQAQDNMASLLYTKVGVQKHLCRHNTTWLLYFKQRLASLLYTKVGIEKHLCRHKTTWLLYFTQRLVFKNIFAGTRQHGFSTLHKGWRSKTSLRAQDNMASLLYTKVGVQKHLCGHKTTWLLYFTQRLVFKNIFAGTRQHGFSTLHKGWRWKTYLRAQDNMASLLYTKVGVQKHLCGHKTTWLLYFTQRLVFKNIFAGTRQHGFSTLHKGWCSKTSLQAQENMASLLYTKVGVQKHLRRHKTTWLLYFTQGSCKACTK